MDDYLNELNELKNIGITIMDKLHKVCEENNLNYYLDSGSLLGAVRHEGYIPWDDDFDVIMFREDYNKLINLPPSVWGDDFILITAETIADGNFIDFGTKLYYLKSKVNYKTVERVNDIINPLISDKVSLDIITVDSCAPNKFLQKLRVFKLKYIYGKALAHRGRLSLDDYSGIEKIAVYFFSRVGKMQSMKRIFDQYSRECTKYNSKKSNYFFHTGDNIAFLDANYLYSWYKNKELFKFEDKLYYGPQEYDEVLKTMYGDYMELPPEEERVPKHLISGSIK